MKSDLVKSLVESRRSVLVCLALTFSILLVYGQVGLFDFTNFDDPFLIYENPIVRAGLTLPGIWWACTTSYFEFWHPLTWLSHMVDCELFGLNPGLHHLTSLAFHIVNTLVLFAVLRRLTGTFWRSAIVAALFALHPMHVESVAWLAERKDVLSSFFFLLSVWHYVRYAQERQDNGSRAGFFYRASLLFFAPFTLA